MVQLLAPSEAAASSVSRSSSSSTGCTERTTNGSVTNSSDADAPLRVLQVDADQAVRAVQRQHHQAGDDRRQRERQVDDRVDQPLAGELVAGEHPRHQQSEEQVDHRHAGRDGQRDAERLQRRVGRDRRQKAFQPPPADCQTIAASGSSTMMLSQIDADADAQRGAAVVAAEQARGPTGVVAGAGGVGLDSSCHPVACL